MLFACLHIRRPRRLRHLRRLAAPVTTVTRLPGRLTPAPKPATALPLPSGFHPAPTPAPAAPATAPDQAEQAVRGWLKGRVAS
ncbi:hypothetical protein OG582_39420 (plasmid) [Streptomyces anulatus]|uniref:hypothetical protein n=1 Tax=Streptomyces anulatus TaxID=1892 RepID=UPI002F90CA78|nr:hypothetical protein OH737_39820 [Streptomyces anulatus]